MSPDALPLLTLWLRLILALMSGDVRTVELDVEFNRNLPSRLQGFDMYGHPDMQMYGRHGWCFSGALQG